MEEALHLYRSQYRPSARYPRPQATICVFALAADSEAEARRLLQTREFWRIGFEQGIRKPLVTPEYAATYPYTDAEKSHDRKAAPQTIVGTAEQVAARLTELAHAWSSTSSSSSPGRYDPAPRHRSYELLAEAFHLRSD